MKNLVAAADLHIRANPPKYRTDNYYNTACRKFRQIISICNKYDADLLVAGDFFDSTRVGHKVVNRILRYIKKLNNNILLVAGQHDQINHLQNLHDSPLFTLIISGKAELLLSEHSYIRNKDMNIYGCSFGKEPIKPKSKDKNVLVIHRTITPEEVPFFLKDGISANEALERYKDYDLIISGDYHQPFKKSNKNTTLINCGPMLRTNIDQRDIYPSVWLIADNKVKRIKLKIESPENVFAIERFYKDKKRKEEKFSKELGNLVKVLKNRDKKPNYEQTVNLVMDEVNAKKATRDKALSILEEVK